MSSKHSARRKRVKPAKRDTTPRPAQPTAAEPKPAPPQPDPAPVAAVQPDTTALIDAARQAEAAGEWVQALSCWESVRAALPDQYLGYGGMSAALRQLGRTDEAAALLQDATGRFSDEAGVPLEQAQIAEAAGDWAEAERCWRAFIARNSGLWWAYTRLATALRHQGSTDEAEDLLVAQRERFPDEIAVFVDHARLAEAATDWPRALERWEAVKARFPDHYIGYAGMVAALRQLGRIDAMMSLLEDAAERLPQEPAVPRELARLAEAAGDWREAERRWRQLLAIAPDAWRAHLGLAAALREQGRIEDAEATLLAQHERPAEHVPLFADYARLAEARGDLPRALARWQVVRDRFPARYDGYAGMASVLRQLQRDDDLRSLLDRIEARFPNEPAAHVDLAQLAEADADWVAAERHWRMFAAANPGIWWSHVKRATALRQQKKLTEAAAVLLETMARFPDQPEPAEEYARLRQEDTARDAPPKR